MYGFCLDHSLKWLVEPQIQCPYSEQKRWVGLINDNYECPLCYFLFEKFSWNTTQLFWIPLSTRKTRKYQFLNKYTETIPPTVEACYKEVNGNGYCEGNLSLFGVVAILYFAISPSETFHANHTSKTLIQVPCCSHLNYFSNPLTDPISFSFQA